MVDSSSRETPWPTFPPSLPPSLTLEIVYARLVVVVAKSIKSASDRCAGRRFGVGQLSGSERDRDIELLKITVDFVSRKIFQESKRRIETKTGFSVPDSAELIARGSEATIIRSFLDF